MPIVTTLCIQKMMNIVILPFVFTIYLIAMEKSIIVLLFYLSSCDFCSSFSFALAIMFSVLGPGDDVCMVRRSAHVDLAPHRQNDDSRVSYLP